MARLRPTALAALSLLAAGCFAHAPPPPDEGPFGRPAPETGPGERAEADEGTDEPSDADLPESEETGDVPSPAPGRDPALDRYELQARLAARARAWIGRTGPFRVRGERFGSDCSGFVEAVYAAEGLALRTLAQRAAPAERSGVVGTLEASRAFGAVFDDAWPAPGDLVFWHDTYDRNRNGKADDRLTHVGIVEYVEDGTVYFLHRGGKGVARGAMTLDRADEARDADGRALNSTLRARSHPVKRGGLAGLLFAGFGRIDPAEVPPGLLVALGAEEVADEDEPARASAAAPASASASPTTAAPKRKPPAHEAKKRHAAPKKKVTAAVSRPKRAAAPTAAPGTAASEPPARVAP
jgi:probable lipoprotein NlpC